MAVKHKIRTNGRGDYKVLRLTARRAIIEHCKECFGWETNQRECVSPHCALFPFRTWDKPKATV